MAGVLIVTDFILITLSELCFTGIISGALKKTPPRMILRRSGSCDGREHTLLSQRPERRVEAAAVVSVHLVGYTHGSLGLAR